MPLTKDSDRARRVGEALLEAFHANDILGEVSMPEHILPPGVERGSREHLHFITLTVAIDYMRDADKLWAAARQTFADPETRYVFEPARVVETGIAKLTADMSRYRLAKRPHKDVQQIWQAICLTLAQHFDGDVDDLLRQGEFDGPRILNVIRSGRYRFPYLRGAKIGPLWIRMLEDSWQGHHFTGLEKLPIPVDVHIAAATVMTGCVSGPDAVAFENLRNAVEEVWFDACTDSEHYPLQFDEPLWHLSRRGCRDTPSFPCVHRDRCPVAGFCTSTTLQLEYGPDGQGSAARLVSR
jgi:hypothetical protein